MCRSGVGAPPGQTGPWVKRLRSFSPWSERRWGTNESPPAHLLHDEDKALLENPCGDRQSSAFQRLHRLSPSGSTGVPLKISLYVVRKMAPSAGSRGGPPISPVASSRPSGTRWTRMASITSSSPGSSVGLSNLGCTQEEKRTKSNDVYRKEGRRIQTMALKVSLCSCTVSVQVQKMNYSITIHDKSKFIFTKNAQAFGRKTMLFLFMGSKNIFKFNKFSY